MEKYKVTLSIDYVINADSEEKAIEEAERMLENDKELKASPDKAYFSFMDAAVEKLK
jgi:hypothetical protein